MGKISAFYTMPHPPIIIPEIGRGEEKKIQATFDACDQVANEIAKIKPDTIIIVTPHGPVFSDAIAISTEKTITGDLGRFGAPNIGLNLKINQKLSKNIISNSKKENIFLAEITKDTAGRYGIEYTLDHGSLVPLYFINKKFPNYNLIHITYGMLPKTQLYKLGIIIQKTIEDSNSNAVFIGSGDLSHKLKDEGPYAYNPQGKKFDTTLISLLEQGDIPGIFNMDPVMIEEAGECGLRSYYIMLGAMNGHKVKGNLLAYEGTFGVGYLVMSFTLNKTDEDTYQKLINHQEEAMNHKIQNESLYVKLARESLTNYLINGDRMDIPSYISPEMKETKTGIFVTLKKEGRLRGCIGTIFPRTENIAQEIIRNAIEAGIHDPRFSPVEEKELKELEFSVDVLTKPKKALESELDPKKYGIIVRNKMKTGLLLPDLEGIDTVEKQLEIALQKGNISKNENYTIEKFQVIRHR